MLAMQSISQVYTLGSLSIMKMGQRNLVDIKKDGKREGS